MKFLLPYFKRYRGKIFLGQGFKLIEAILELLLPLVMASLIDHGIKTGDQAAPIERNTSHNHIAVKNIISTHDQAISLC